MDEYNLDKSVEVIDSVLTFGDNARIVNGIIKGNGVGGATQAVPGTDYVAPSDFESLASSLVIATDGEAEEYLNA